MNLLILSLFLISPFIIVPYFVPLQSSAINSTIITPITLEAEYQPVRPQESQFAVLIGQEPQPQVLGAAATQEIIEESTTGSSTIAVLGDSMIDVMQPELPQLKNALKNFYPQVQFKLLNYGVGASSLEFGLERLTSNYTYLGKDFPSLLSQNPDIIVIESFAYNHWANNQSGLDRQWLTLAKIVETIKNQSQAKIILAAHIGPDETSLCDGIEGLHLLPKQKREKAQNIRAYLQNLINFATSQGYPLADAYHPSLDSNGNGQSIYVNAGDHLHPSGLGGELFAQKIAEAIAKNNLL